MRNLERGAELAATAAKENLPVHLCVMDVDSDTSVANCFAALRAAGIEIDVLINNAGIEKHGAIEELSLGEIRAVMETNYFGAIRCIQQVVGPMRERGNGCIVNISSVAGKISSSPLGAYAATKHALEAVSEALAMELRPFGVGVLLVQPGIIDTAMAHSIDMPTPSKYRQGRQLSAMFHASLRHGTPPSVVAEVIRQALESGTTQLRHPAGPDAAGFLAWRAGMSDEDWIQFNTLNDEDYKARVKATFGMDIQI